jgi:hypothetical protein
MLRTGGISPPTSNIKIAFALNPKRKFASVE